MIGYTGTHTSLERILEEAHLSGDLYLSGRKLKEFPHTGKYNLTDTVVADLSRNRFVEFPVEVTKFWCLEHLSLYRNMIRFIPDTVTYLQSLVYLDLCRNQLSILPPSLYQLPLQILLVSNNKLQSVPAELGQCKTLWELDISCNQITHLPPQLGQLTLLRYLNVRSNLLLELPLELTYLRLMQLDISQNRIATLPVELRQMISLEILRVSENPLVAPPAAICLRGRIHIFKWLELRCTKDDKSHADNRRESHKKSQQKYNDLSLRARYQDSVMSKHSRVCNTEGPSQFYTSSDGLNEITTPRLERSSSEREVASNRITKPIIKLLQMTGTNSAENPNISQVSQHGISGEKKTSPPPHLQSYKEYKESLRQQRILDRLHKLQQNSNPSSQNSSPASSPLDGNVLSITPPASPKPSISVLPASSNLEVKKSTSVLKVNDLLQNKPHFTIRREYDKAREEAELLDQLRNNIEARLKMKLPEDLSNALKDGVVLCHLANYIQPCSVTSIHVPSPTVPKLTTARCRRNVDSFLEACRKIGMDENVICCTQDILEGKGLVRIAITVAELINFQAPAPAAHLFKK